MVPVHKSISDIRMPLKWNPNHLETIHIAIIATGYIGINRFVVGCNTLAS